MSSALKPALPSTGGQSPGNASTGTGKPPGMAQHASATNPYTSAPLGHVAQNLAVGGGLPNAHSNMGLPPQNIAANMSINQVPLGINQTPAHNTVPPLKTPSVPAPMAGTLPPSHRSNTQHPYLPPASTANAPPSGHEEGTALPPSQNSGHLMALHRASQQLIHQQVDRFKQVQPAQTTPQQQPPPQQPTQQPQAVLPPSQHQSNGMAASPSETNLTAALPSKVAPLAPTSPAKPTESPSSSSNSSSPTVATPAVASVALQNHVSPSIQSSTNSTNDTSLAIKPATEAPSTTDASPPTSAASIEAKTIAAPSAAVASPAVTPAVAVAATPVPEQPVAEASTSPVANIKAPAAAATAPAAAPSPPKEPAVAKPQSTLKLATTPRNINNRKREQPKQHVSKAEAAPKSSPAKPSPNNKPPEKTPTKPPPRSASEERKSKRNRIRTQPYQSPLPELALISKLSNRSSSPTKNQDEKLIVFYKNEFLAVRNADGGFYVCQAVQNVYKSSVRIRIRWLSQDKQDKIYIPDFYDTTEFDCILTNINMNRVEKGKYNLPKDELERTENILKRALAVESGDSAPALTEEHPDGLDLSLFRDESQLKKKQRKALKRKSRESAAAASSSSASPSKKTKKSPERAKARKMAVRSPVKTPIKKPTHSLQSSSKATSSRETRKSDGGRAERAKRRGEVPTTSTAKTSPVVDPKKARVLAKVALKNAIPVSIPSSSKDKKKGGKVPGKPSAPLPTATTSKSGSSGGVKTSTRSQGAVASASSFTRRKKGRK